MITVYTVTYNEELMIQFMIDHYRRRFPNCRIVVNDNLSTDNTVKIALKNNCEVVPYDTNGQLQEKKLVEIKNNCWKNAETDWVLACDLDELLEINESQLKKEEALGTTIIKTQGYDMVAMTENLDLASMKYGAKEEGAGKSCLFNKKFIKDINYSTPGAHICNPVGTIVTSLKSYKLLNYCYINYDVTVERYKVYFKRKKKSEEDMRMGWITHNETPEEIRQLYTQARQKAVRVR